MKIKVSGSMGFKLMLAPYSPADVISFVEIEDETDKLFTEDKVEELQDKVNLLLKKDVMNKMKILMKEYAEQKSNLANVLNGGE